MDTRGDPGHRRRELSLFQQGQPHELRVAPGGSHAGTVPFLSVFYGSVPFVRLAFLAVVLVSINTKQAAAEREKNMKPQPEQQPGTEPIDALPSA